MSLNLINKNILKDVIIHPEMNVNHFDLVYVNDNHLTIKRCAGEKQFLYVRNSKSIFDKNILNRIQQLVIPPNWKKVRISELDNGHLQAVGRDEKGRKQYRYHSKWNALRKETKFLKMVHFGNNLPNIRNKVEEDLKQKTWSLTKVLALIIKMLEETHIRIGNIQYAKRNKTYGLTTLRSRHIINKEGKLKLEFIGKRGKEHKITIRNKRLVKLLNQCQDIPGWEVFKYYDEYGDKKSVDSGLVNNYIHSLSGELFTAKDFRTWSASLICFNTLLDLGIEPDDKIKKKNILHAVDTAAKELGNTRNVSRKYYIHPEIIHKYEDNSIQHYFDKVEETTYSNFLTASEKVMLELMQNYRPSIF
jgi:DNA topoisomerase-1